jgi:hypothetical protein
VWRLLPWNPPWNPPVPLLKFLLFFGDPPPNAPCRDSHWQLVAQGAALRAWRQRQAALLRESAFGQACGPALVRVVATLAAPSPSSAKKDPWDQDPWDQDWDRLVRELKLYSGPL